MALTTLTAGTLAFAAACGGGGGGGGAEDTGGAEGTGAAGGGGETITVASDIAYRPFEFDQGGEPVGFDIDLMNEIGERAGFTPEFQNVTFDGIIPGLGSNLYDAAISAMTITPEREEQIDFSDPYFNADQSLMVPADSGITSIEDGLENSVVGVQIGTTGASQAEQFQQEGQIGEVRTFDTIEDAFTALESGQVDAVINDLPVSQDRVNQSDGALEIVQTIPTGEQYGIAFPQDSELVEPVNEALQEIKDDGTYAEIYREWIGREPESIP
ncbi:ABC-type amino acid transport/signal transduction systems periplasmic component/domain [Rubrobacter radiotolerans]|nr:ABC-type amino acid transport/signal transduction systems periplasmic component/domain [Rubrobacter radiotolerans]